MGRGLVLRDRFGRGFCGRSLGGWFGSVGRVIVVQDKFGGGTISIPYQKREVQSSLAVGIGQSSLYTVAIHGYTPHSFRPYPQDFHSQGPSDAVDEW